MCWTVSCANEGVNCLLPRHFKLDHEFPFGSCSFLLSPLHLHMLLRAVSLSLSSFVHKNACEPHHFCAAEGIKAAAAAECQPGSGHAAGSSLLACAPKAHPELVSVTAEPPILRGVGQQECDILHMSYVQRAANLTALGVLLAESFCHASVEGQSEFDRTVLSSQSTFTPLRPVRCILNSKGWAQPLQQLFWAIMHSPQWTIKLGKYCLLTPCCSHLESLLVDPCLQLRLSFTE